MTQTPSHHPDCPVCSHPSKLVHSLPQGEIKTVLSGLFKADIPPHTVETDYTLNECLGCSLVFADPMLPGNDEFYGWITSFDRYQAKARWEWKAVKQQLIHNKAKTLFELGAGTGKLMEYLSSINNLTFTGIDVSPTSVAAAQAKGFDVRETAFKNLSDVMKPGETFDAIVLSHVLEHVESPSQLLQGLLKHLSQGGCIMAAVPYSPMSRELTDWDIMNMPPHHLTRWNAKSLTSLADALGCTVQLHTAKAKSPLKRALQDTAGEILGDKHPSMVKRIITALGNYDIFQKHLTQHKSRERVNGRLAGESVLAVFTQKS